MGELFGLSPCQPFAFLLSFYLETGAIAQLLELAAWDHIKAGGQNSLRANQLNFLSC